MLDDKLSDFIYRVTNVVTAYQYPCNELWDYWQAECTSMIEAGYTEDDLMKAWYLICPRKTSVKIRIAQDIKNGCGSL